MKLISALRPQEILVACVILLLAFSAIMIFSAGAFYHSAHDSFHFLHRHMLWLPLAALVGILFSSVDYRLYRRYYLHVLALTVLLLALVLVPQIGRSVNNSRRWLPVGDQLQFQPSELAKLAVVLLVAGFVSNDPQRTRRFFAGFLPICGGVLLVVGLILAEPDLGSSVFILGLAGGLLMVAGMRLRYLAASALAVVPVLAFYVRSHWTMVEKRLLGFLDPESQYQTLHSLIALGSGGAFGMGLGTSTEKMRYLPEAHTDFIFAVVGEELGFAGCIAVILAFLVLVWSGAAIAFRARDRFGFLVASGITIALGYQAAINIAVVTGSAPTKGIPLPLLSFGGSGLCMTLAQIGILLSVAGVASDGRADEIEGREEAAEPDAEREAEQAGEERERQRIPDA